MKTKGYPGLKHNFFYIPDRDVSKTFETRTSIGFSIFSMSVIQRETEPILNIGYQYGARLTYLWKNTND